MECHWIQKEVDFYTRVVAVTVSKKDLGSCMFIWMALSILFWDVARAVHSIWSHVGWWKVIHHTLAWSNMVAL